MSVDKRPKLSKSAIKKKSDKAHLSGVSRSSTSKKTLETKNLSSSEADPVVAPSSTQDSSFHSNNSHTQQGAPMKITYQFTIDESNAILQALAQLPYQQVFGIIQSIQAQAAPQVKAIEEAAAQQQGESVSSEDLAHSS